MIPTKEQLSGYIDQGLSQIEIGDMWGVGRNVVRGWEYGCGLKGRRSHGFRRKPTGEQIESLQRQGLTLGAIAEMHNTPRGTIKARLATWRKRRMTKTPSGAIVLLGEQHPHWPFLDRPIGEVVADLERFGSVLRE